MQETKEKRRSLSELSARDSWLLTLALSEGKPATNFQTSLSLPGWVVDSIAFLDEKKLEPLTIPLRPGESLWPWSNETKAKNQLKEWKTTLGGSVIYLLVPDQGQPGDNPWLAQPVRRDWLEKSEPELLELYKAFQGKPEELMVRAAYIARTGSSPKDPWAEAVESLDS